VEFKVSSITVARIAQVDHIVWRQLLFLSAQGSFHTIKPRFERKASRYIVHPFQTKMYLSSLGRSDDECGRKSYIPILRYELSIPGGPGKHGSSVTHALLNSGCELYELCAPYGMLAAFRLRMARGIRPLENKRRPCSTRARRIATRSRR